MRLSDIDYPSFRSINQPAAVANCLSVRGDVKAPIPPVVDFDSKK